MVGVIKEAYFSNYMMKPSPHFHDCHQIIFIKKGLVELEIDNHKYHSGAGDIIIFSRYGNHSIKILSDRYERYIVRINPGGISDEHKEYSVFFARSTKSGSILSTKNYTKDFEKLFDVITKEKKTDDAYSNKAQQLLIDQLLIMIYRANPEIFKPFEEEDFDMVFELQKRLENNYEKQYTLEKLAKDYHTSISTLTHQFKRVTGFSVFEYLCSCRISMAKYMLAKTNLPIEEIVSKTGFSDSSNFSRTFKNNVGITPTEFRKKYKIKNTADSQK